MPVIPFARIAALSTVLFSVISQADCNRPTSPVLPDGSQATKEEMIKGQKAVKTYMAGTNQYLECLNKQEQENAETDTDEIKASRVQAYNAAVADMEQIAASFNGEIKRWKAQSDK